MLVLLVVGIDMEHVDIFSYIDDLAWQDILEDKETITPDQLQVGDVVQFKCYSGKIRKGHF